MTFATLLTPSSVNMQSRKSIIQKKTKLSDAGPCRTIPFFNSKISVFSVTGNKLQGDTGEEVALWL